MIFKLSEKQAERGYLNATDLSNAALMPIRAIDLSMMPHYDSLKNGWSFTADKLKERSAAYLSVFKQIGVTSGNAKRDANFSIDAAKKIVPYFYESLVPLKDKDGQLAKLSQFNCFNHFETILERGFSDANDLRSPLWIGCYSTCGPRILLIPGTMYEKSPDAVLYKKQACVVLVNHKITPQQAFSRDTCIPEELMPEFPDEKAHMLYVDLHELRHMQQVTYAPIEAGSTILCYYSELDADMFARAVLRDAGIGEKTCEAYLHIRYIDLLIQDDPQYWFAPALEAIEKGMDPFDFHTTSSAVQEVRFRVFLEHWNLAHDTLPSNYLQHLLSMDRKNASENDINVLEAVEGTLDFYSSYSDSIRGENPAPIYTALRRVVEGTSITDPFIKHLAKRILCAVDYFNPDLSNADNPPSRERIENRMAQRNRNKSVGPVF
ncbi:MAG: hypothetical protein PHE27_00935 [Alphaproteobacteria bacterium]|nr:hypothetical protein [Alphaproteobacteria bacterium]